MRFSRAKTTRGPTGHEISQRIEEGLAGVDSVDLLCLMFGDFEHFHTENVEIILFVLFFFADCMLADGIRFDDGQSALKRFHWLV